MTGSRPARGGLLALALVFAFATPALAQNAIIRGTVTSSDRSEPLPGANLVIAELNLSVLASDRGTYQITIPEARLLARPVTLTARAIGFKAVHRGIVIRAGEQVINFTLHTDINRLEEVVVTGVTEAVERTKVPFAVGRITAEELPVPALNPLLALQGKIAGVRIANTSGKPGSSPEILLRGPTSINANGRGLGPLIIVDDVIMNVGSLEELGGLDIESLEVVKGAAGASLYGTRAANGVITIKTKRGLTGQDGVKLNVRTEYGFSDFSVDYGQPVNHHLQLDETGKRFCVLVPGSTPCSSTIDWMSEILRINNVVSDTTRVPQSVVYNSPNSADLRNLFQVNRWPGRYYNAAAQILTRSPTLLLAVDASGKVQNVSFYVSGQFSDEAGAVKGLNGIQSRRGRVNLDFQARSDLKLSVSTLFDDTSNDLRNGGSSAGTLFSRILFGTQAGTNYLARDTLGRLLVQGGGTAFSTTANGGGALLYDSENYANDRSSNRFLGSVTARYFPAAWVSFDASFAYDGQRRTDFEIYPRGYRTLNTNLARNEGQINFANLSSESFSTSLTATFRSRLADNLNAKFSVRGIYDQTDLASNGSGGDVLRVTDIHQTSNTSTNFRTSSSSSQTRNTGLFAGTTLDYKDRYILEGSVRYDGSSRFGPGSRWAPFGRISAVWRVSEEPFWKVGFINELRFRASRGTAGSTPPFEAQYQAYNVSATGFALDQAGNRYLRPETTTELELGTDFELFNRIGVELTYAHATTRDQIFPVTAPAGLGFGSQWRNAGTLVNRTWEVGVKLPIVNSRSLSWQLGGTWDRTRTEVSELFVPEFLYTGGTGQGTASFFLITADRTLNNGFAKNRFGNIWGRKFYRTCGELPASVRSDCGDGRSYQINDQGWLVWVGAGNSWRDGISRNLWQTVLQAGESPWGVPLSFGHPIVDRPLAGEPGAGSATSQILGNVLPDFRFTLSNSLQYKRIALYALLDATIGHDINNQAEGWGLLDFNSARFDQAGNSVETAKPLGYSWRVGPPENTLGTGGFYDVLNANNYSVEDGSFAKLREVSLSYKVGSLGGIGDWTLSLVGRNLLTITRYSGLDPEVGACATDGTSCPSGSGLVNQTNGPGDFPTLRTFSFSLATRF